MTEHPADTRQWHSAISTLVHIETTLGGVFWVHIKARSKGGLDRRKISDGRPRSLSDLQWHGSYDYGVILETARQSVVYMCVPTCTRLWLNPVLTWSDVDVTFGQSPNLTRTAHGSTLDVRINSDVWSRGLHCKSKNIYKGRRPMT